MEANTKKQVEEILKLQKMAIEEAKKGNKPAVKKILEDKSELKKKAIEEPEYVNESQKETLAKADQLGLSPLQMRAVTKAAYGKKVVNEELHAFQEWSDTIKIGLMAHENSRRSAGEKSPDVSLDTLAASSPLFAQYISDGVQRFSSFIEADVEKRGVSKANVIYTTNSGYGAEWIPEIWSRELVDIPHLPHVLLQGGAIPIIQMPGKNYTYAGFAGDANFLIGSEQSSTDPSSRVGAVDIATRETNFAAKKLEARVTLSTEEAEDAIFNAVLAYREKLRRAAMYNLEDIVINGSDAGTHFDSDTAAEGSTYHLKLLDGLRQVEQTTDAGTDLSSCTTAKVANLRNQLNVAFRAKEDLLYVTSPVSTTIVGTLTEFVSLEKYGPAAYVLNGEVGNLAGVKVVESERMRENVNTSGVYDGTTTTKTIMLCINKEAFRFGYYKNLELQVVAKPEYDLIWIIARMRIDFQPIQDTTSYIVVSLGYNMAV